ncbi:MAG: hypothetical protein UW11_C0007G0014 [Parcubacteria group bacterium GW2011_GWA2_43_9b]|uniref:Uncharacterized protein n=1 Tax=Candidatus Portnoybacteria bacterium RIFCSPLOWO2_02_FULL_39_11 TaxID=1802001 RepID=A0A1G2FVX4_9BACT|nr:MAG: hypothetical protein UW11_C0007G0014 [Parcubacteria group bacterium GW2011_GWA2_43_9b]OGZ42236.1 MAG: hypothetical protein A3B04_02785 [Candidatus Portnoybacteria bacterium RIFCSPLOWO2_02_FULL_39_11]
MNYFGKIACSLFSVFFGTIVGFALWGLIPNPKAILFGVISFLIYGMILGSLFEIHETLKKALEKSQRLNS